MAIVTTQLISKYYEDYRNTEITFTKDILHTVGMDPRQIYIKCAGSQWPCIINSTSFTLCRIIIGTKGGAYQQLSKTNEPQAVSIRFYFYQSDGQPRSFFVSGKVTNLTPYMNSTELAIATITFTQRPPDDLIEVVGHLLDANANAIRRKEERIIINADSCRKLGIPHEEQIIIIQNVPRHCILRDLSFSGAKVILLGLSKFLMNKEVQLRLEFDEPHEIIELKGIILGTTPIEGRTDMVAANIRFDDSSITLSYKIHINNYITTVRKDQLDNQNKQAQPMSASQMQAKAQQDAIMAQRAQQQAAAAAAAQAAQQNPGTPSA